MTDDAALPRIMHSWGAEDLRQSMLVVVHRAVRRSFGAVGIIVLPE